jgi:hypothetical protein
MSMAFGLRLLGPCLCIAAAVAQDDAFNKLPLRISSVRPNGACIVDRGRRDLVQIGDRVVLEPRNGKAVLGSVVEVEDRTSRIDVVDRAAVLPIGTKGYLLLPKGRRAPAAAPAAPPVPPPAPAAPKEEEWRPGMPLLGTSRPPRPSERPSSAHGRYYADGHLVRTLDSWKHSYLNTGADVEIDNLGGGGGTLRFHGEFDWNTEFSGETGTDLRLHDLSYVHGGSRFEPLRWQVGRFLPLDMPEFGLLDGIEIGYRREGGHRFGGSVGYLPLLDEDMESFADLQVAAWYVWNGDPEERVSFGIGYQKTWHRLAIDRDLVVAKFRYLPLEGWDVAGSVWVDFYHGSDALKDDEFGITRANLFTSRRWQEGGIELAYDHEEYPELLRNELLPTILPLTISEAHQDRVSLHAWSQQGEGTRWHVRLTGWVDEEREGGAFEFGVEIPGLLQKDTRTGFALFDVQGLTSTVVGARIEHGGTFCFGRLDALYELGFVHHEGFPEDRNDLIQNRLGVVVSSDLGNGWDSMISIDGTLWDKELSYGVGLYLQLHF